MHKNGYIAWKYRVKIKCKTCVVRVGKFAGKKGGQQEYQLKEVR